MTGQESRHTHGPSCHTQKEACSHFVNNSSCFGIALTIDICFVSWAVGLKQQNQETVQQCNSAHPKNLVICSFAQEKPSITEVDISFQWEAVVKRYVTPRIPYIQPAPSSCCMDGDGSLLISPMLPNLLCAPRLPSLPPSMPPSLVLSRRPSHPTYTNCSPLTPVAFASKTVRIRDS